MQKFFFVPCFTICNLFFLIQELEAKCTAISKSLESDNDEGSSADERQGERISKRRKTVDEMETEIS